MLKEGQVFKAKYRILKLLGNGGMSKVWLAEDKKLKKQWAIKEINKKLPAFEVAKNENGTLTEIEIMKSLDHPSAPRIVDIYDDERTLSVVMDYVDGINLQTKLNQEGAQPQERVAKWMIQICELLSQLHKQEKPVIYRDMKPSNIMLTRDGTAKVIDFGIARVIDKDNPQKAQALGTKGYASPEHFTGETDERSDIYTVGVTMYQLLTNVNPTHANFKFEPLRKIDITLSSGLERIVEKATKLKPEERYQTMDEMIADLKNYKKLEEEHALTIAKKIRKAKVLSQITAIFIIVAMGLLGFTYATEEIAYRSLISQPTSDWQTKTKSIAKAIDLKPARKEAYIKLMDEYSVDGLSENERIGLNELLDAYESKMFIPTVKDDVNYKYAETMVIYEKKDIEERLNDALPYFQLLAESKHKDVAKGFISVSEFLKASTPSEQLCEDFMNNSTLMINALAGDIGEGSTDLMLAAYDGMVQGIRKNMDVLKTKVNPQGVKRILGQITTDTKNILNDYALSIYQAAYELDAAF